MDRPNVFTIPPGVPFLDALVAALLDGRLVPGFDPLGPFALADTILYLPTRRAARAIRERFLARLGRPLLLPKIRTLGDFDEDEESLLDLEAAEPPAAIPAMERQLVLTGLVLAWSGELVRSAAEFPDEELIIPASPADAARLAASLGSLMDQVGAGEDAWKGLTTGAPGELAKYWDITLEFLKIATAFWPAHLRERGLVDAATRRDLMIIREAERLLARGSSAPIIAAGSTGSVKATAALLAAIARLPNGAVVLPGLDQGLDDASWGAIGISEHEPAGAGHPQYGLKLLLEGMAIARDAVLPLTQAASGPALRDRFVSEAMRPASTAELWSGSLASSPEEKRAAIGSIGIVHAANEREEALSAAVLLRRAAENPGSVAALVTPDRGLARRVAVELKRWGIDVDDSAGRPLGRTPPGVLARLVAETALGGCAAETLLALLQHPLAAFGLAPPVARRNARSLERAVLRGPRLRPGLASLRHALEVRFAERWNAAEGERVRPGQAAHGLSRRKWEAARDLAARIETALAPLERLAAKRGKARLADLVEAHLTALLAVAELPKGETSALFADEAGEALAATFEELRANAHAGPAIAPRDYSALFTALIERAAVRRRGGLDPRIHIWGTLEARLQSVDMIVLGGLNEGTWPAQTRVDPLLSRPMRDALALDPPERRIGLAAHDFAQALGQPEVWLTRSDQQDGEPRVASRWLQRLTAYAGADLTAEMRARGAKVLGWARSLDAPPKPDLPKRPRPSPPVDKRPKKLSATRIETLIRDPYAVYAHSVLKLRPFEPLAKLPEASERGTLIHNILENFVRERPGGPFDKAAEARLLEIGRVAFAEHSDFPEIIALWWPRFEKIARWFVQEEARWGDVVTRHVERTGEAEMVPGFVLSARADRLDALAGGGIAILDYKTGAPPSPKEVRTLSAQLPLEALIVRRGGFAGVPAAEPERIVYYRLNGKDQGGEEHDRTEWKRDGRMISLAETLESTEKRLVELVAHFSRPEAEYLSNKIPKPGRRTYVGDYDHLARISEWVKTDQEDDE